MQSCFLTFTLDIFFYLLFKITPSQFSLISCISAFVANIFHFKYPNFRSKPIWLIMTSHPPSFGHRFVKAWTQNRFPFLPLWGDASFWKALPQSCRWFCHKTRWRMGGSPWKMTHSHKSPCLNKLYHTRYGIYPYPSGIFNSKLKRWSPLESSVPGKRSEFTCQ